MKSIKELIEGEIYFKSPYPEYIFIYLPMKSYVGFGSYIEVKGGRFYNYSSAISGLNLENIGDVKLATPEQRHWLLECIKANKFIPLDKIPKEGIECYEVY